MEEGLIVGYDLCKDFCRISWLMEGREEPQDLVFSEEENPYLIQNSICRKKGEDVWLVGREAYETALLGGGAIVDRLLRLVEKSGFSTIEGVKYTAEELLLHFLEETLEKLFRETKTRKVSQIMFSVQELDGPVLDAIIRCMHDLGYERSKIHIISHTESYLYYVLSQKRELWSNISMLFDLSGDGLNYYEMEVLRGLQPNVAFAKRTFLEEGFSLEILDSLTGKKMADNIMTQCADRMLSKKLISSAYLSGNGMDKVQLWGDSFLRTLCNRRRVFFTENLFSRGAVYAALEFLREKSAYPFRIMCEGRIGVDITMDVTSGVHQKTMTLCTAGMNWYESRAGFDIILDRENVLRLKVKKIGERSPLTLEIPLTEFSGRPDRMSRINVSLLFTSEDVFNITLKDKGFGEFLPATDTVIKRTFTVN